MAITIHGIKNCDSVKKARKWFESNNISVVFHDFRVDGINQQWLSNIEQQVGWETLLNKRGTTYRQLDDSVKSNINKMTALELMLQQPTLIKRPVTTSGEQVIVGFNASQYEQHFQS